MVAITQFTGLQALTEKAAALGFATLPASAGKFTVAIPAEWAAPTGYKWVYKLNTAPAEEGAYGTAYTGTDVTGAEITAGANTYCHLLLVDADSKPVKTLTLPVNAG